MVLRDDAARLRRLSTQVWSDSATMLRGDRTARVRDASLLSRNRNVHHGAGRCALEKILPLLERERRG
jgi:hypothetical protein